MNRKKKRRINRRRYPRNSRRKYSLSRDMKSPAYAKFKKEVKDRDGRKCQWPACESTKALEVHHIRKWSDFPSLRFDMSNGITLCKKCHKRVTGNEEIYSEFFIRLLEWQMLNKLKELDDKDD